MGESLAYNFCPWILFFLELNGSYMESRKSAVLKSQTLTYLLPNLVSFRERDAIWREV